MREGWIAEAKADPYLVGKLEPGGPIMTDISRALDSIGDPKLKSEFVAAMDLTGAGDNPAFIKTFHKMATRMIEGKATSSGGPSPLGQSKTGQPVKPSVASAMYPNLPSAVN